MSRISIFLLTFLFSICSGVTFAVPPQEALNSFLSSSGVPNGSMAVKIVDLKSKKVLASHNSSQPLIPASIMKSVTISTLLGETGPNWRYHTNVYTDGPVEMGKLKGNIVIVGSMDPSVHTPYEPYGTDLMEEIYNALYDQHITSVEGDVIIDNSEFAGPSRPSSWAPGDHKTYYGTGSHAFNYANNVVNKAAVENPGAIFAKNLKTKLQEKGIPVEATYIAPGKRTRLLDHASPSVDEIMRSCMMRSDNLFAECMIRTYGKLSGGDGSTADAAKRETGYLKSKGYPMEGVNIVDGSGLSRQNRVTADFMAAMLQNMSKDVNYASFFPLAGQEGTMKKFLAGTVLDSYIAMKTGSMNGIQCYAGYKLNDNYEPTHVIVIIMNDLKDRDKAKRTLQQMLIDIFDEAA